MAIDRESGEDVPGRDPGAFRDGPARGADRDPPTPHVLIAEDELHIARILATLLEDARLRVTIEGDGLSALQRIREDGSISLVVLDLLMPGMGGMDVLRETRLLDREIPIVVLTGKGQTDVREQALELGANEVFIKPFSPRKLMNRILELCG